MYLGLESGIEKKSMVPYSAILPGYQNQALWCIPFVGYVHPPAVAKLQLSLAQLAAMTHSACSCTGQDFPLTVEKPVYGHHELFGR